jgi:hypothetical protein
MKSGDPGDTKYQGDSQGRLRTDAIKNASEPEHDTGPCFRSFKRLSWRSARSTLTAITFWRFGSKQPQHKRNHPTRRSAKDGPIGAPCTAWDRSYL